MTSPQDNPGTQPGTSLHSTLASDPDMVELVQFFVEEMADRVQTISDAADANDLGQLRTVAHQLKGAGAGYGFEPITDAAGALEHLIDESGPATEVESMRQQIDALIDLCRRATV